MNFVIANNFVVKIERIIILNLLFLKVMLPKNKIGKLKY